MRYKRRIKLIKPGLQLKLTLAFTLMGCLAGAFQLLITNVTVLNLAERVSLEGAGALDQFPRVLLMNLASTLMIFVPLMVAMGILLTHRIAGPIYRFERYMEELARGEAQGPCRIRKGDLLQDLCDRINTAVVAMRGDAAEAGEEEQGELAPVTGDGEAAEEVSKAA